MRVGSLFSGIGALDIAVHSVLGDSRTSWFVEREGFCQEILSSRFPGVPVHGDVKECRCRQPQSYRCPRGRVSLPGLVGGG